VTSRDFCYWLQGLFELGDPKALDEKQTDLVKRHLAMVFLHEIDPSAGGPAQPAALNDAHQGKKPQPVVPKIGGVGPGGIIYRC
jgi:hypothetical protein